MQTPLYQGTQYNPARPPQADPPVQHPFAQQFHASNQALIQNARNLELAIQERQEYTLEQNRSAALQEAFHSMNMEMLQALQIEDGMEGSLFDSNGLLNQEAVDEIKQKYLAVADNWTSGFTSDQGMRSAAEAQNKYRASVNEAIDSKILASLKPRALAALDRNIKADIAFGNYGSAISRNDNAVSRGLKSQEQADIENNDIMVDKWLKDVNVTDDEATLKDFLKNPVNKDFFYNNPEVPNAIRRKLKSSQKYKGEPEKVVASSVNGKTTYTRTTRKAPPAGGGLIRALIEPTANKLYRYNPKDPETQKTACAIFRSFVDSHAFEQDRDDFSENFYVDADMYAETLGVTKSSKDRIIKARKDALKANIPEFKPDQVKKDLLANMAVNRATTAQGMPKMLWENTYNRHRELINDALTFAELDYNEWVESDNNKEKPILERARMFQKFLLKHRDEELQYLHGYAWDQMHLDEYMKRFEAMDNTAKQNVYKDMKARGENAEAFKASFNHWTRVQNMNKKSYQDAIHAADMVDNYYMRGEFAPQNRAKVRQALSYQANNVHFETSLDSLDVAEELPQTHTECIIYVNPDPERTGSVSRLIPEAKDGKQQHGYIIVQTDNDIFRVKLVETPKVAAPVPSVWLQKRMAAYGEYFNHMSFKNNILSFKEVAEPAPTSRSSYRYLDDGLVPAEDTGELDLSSVDINYDDATGEPSLFPDENAPIY